MLIRRLSECLSHIKSPQVVLGWKILPSVLSFDADRDAVQITQAKGELIIAKASAAKFEPISRTPLLTGRCWSVPVLANGRIYVRNAAGDVVCASVK